MEDVGGRLLVDVDGLPRRLRHQQSEGLPSAVCVFLVVLGGQGLAWSAFGGAGPLLAVLSTVALVSGGAGGALIGTRSHLRLDPEGIRRHDGLRYRRRVRPWTTVREVRPTSRWNDHPELLGPRATDEDLPLVGWSDDDARELGRRLECARRAALAPVAQETSYAVPPEAAATGQVVVDLDGLPPYLVAPMGGRRWRAWSLLVSLGAASLLLWHLMSWLLTDRSPGLWPFAVGVLVLWQGVQALLLGRRRRVLLRPTGVVAEGAPDDREQAWSARTHVRLPSRWQEPPRLLNLVGGPVTLWGLDEQQALLLRRRVEEAVARASAVTGNGGDGESDEGQVTRSG